jgi:uncharacterized Zn ribbon protein
MLTPKMKYASNPFSMRKYFKSLCTQVQRSETPDSMQMDTTSINTKYSSDHTEMSGDAQAIEKDSPVKTADVPVKENVTSASVKGFKEWFENNKANLESEFPGMKTAELKKEAVKKFKVNFFIKITCSIYNLFPIYFIQC